MVINVFNVQKSEKCKIIHSIMDYNIENTDKITKKCVNIYNEYFTKIYTNPIEHNQVLGKIRKNFQNDNINIKTKRLILILHGWGVDSSLYDKVSKNLTGHGMVLSFDFWGFGKNKDIDHVLNLNDYAMQVIKLMLIFDFDELCIVAHSFGSRVLFSILKIFLHSSEYNRLFSFSSECERFKHQFSRLNKIVLSGGAGVKPRFSLIKKIKILQYKHLKKKCKKNHKYIKKLSKYGSNDYKNAKNENLRKTFVNVVNSHSFENLTRNDLSLLTNFFNFKFYFLYGKNDTSTPLYMAKKMSKMLSGSKLDVLNNSGHFCFLDNFDKFMSCVNKFFINDK